MDIIKIEKFLRDNKKPDYRLKQIKKAVFGDLIENWLEAITLPEELRLSLEKDFPIFGLVIIYSLESKNKDSIKAVLKLKDGNIIEAVLMKYKNGRNTVCVSSQAGCAVKCGFCATGELGLKRNLTSEEIIDQVLYFARLLKKKGRRVDNVVFMGMGEPFLNYDIVIKAIKILNDKDGFNLGVRHISVSTCGIIPGIKKFADENLQCNLAVSLHAADGRTRTKLMPVNATYPLVALMRAADDYIEKTNRKVMFEYLLIENVNDSPEDASKLADLMKNNLYHVNLIKYHKTGGRYNHSSESRRLKFFDLLKKRGVSVTFRVSFGEDILAACGQLGGLNADAPNIKTKNYYHAL